MIGNMMTIHDHFDELLQLYSQRKKLYEILCEQEYGTERQDIAIEMVEECEDAIEAEWKMIDQLTKNKKSVQ